MNIGISPILVWTIVGVLLLIIEINTFTFVLSFFGIGALLTAFTTWIHLTPNTGSQAIAFVLSSLLLMLVLRKTARKLFPGTKDKTPDYMGQKVKVVKTINPDEEGTVTYRGSDWIAYGDAASSFPQGELVEIVGRDGIRFKVAHSTPPKQSTDI